MKFFTEIYEASETEEFSKLNKVAMKFLLLEIFLVPIVFMVDELFSFIGVYIKSDLFGLLIWISSFISFGSGILSIYLSIKGINNSYGKKIIFNICLVIGLFGLILLSGLVFLPHKYILFKNII